MQPDPPRSSSPISLGAFARRVRLARAWKGAGVGASVGAIAASAWVGLDALRLVFAEGWHLGAMVGGGALAGALWGGLRAPARDLLARSVDRRGGLRDRLTTAGETGLGSFESLVRSDARTAAEGLDARELYPVKTGRLHLAALVLSGMAAGLFILETDPTLLRPSLRPQAEAAKAKAKLIERVVAKVLDPKEKSPDELKRLALEAERLRKEIERDRLKPEQAMEQAQKIAEQAQKLAQKSADEALKATDDAETALQKLQKAALEQKSIPVGSLDQMPTSMEDAQAKQDAAQKAADDAKAQADAAQKALQDAKNALKKPNLSEAERKEAEAAAKKAEAAADKAQQNLASMQKALELSKEAKAGLEALMKDPAFKELLKMAQELQKNAAAAKAGKAPHLTKEQLEEMRKKAEELGKQLKDPEFRKAFMEALKKALEEMKKGGQCKGFCLGLGLGLFPGMGGPGPGPDNDTMLFDTGRVNKNENGKEGKGKGLPLFAPTQRGDGPGPETFVEIKGPTTVGTRSSIPFQAEIPEYREKAESAIRQNAIPKKHQKRVHDYFTGLGK